MSLGVIPIFWFEFLSYFLRKSQKGAKRKTGQKMGPFAAVKGYLVAARPKGQKRPPQVRQGVALLRRGEVTVHRGKIFGFLFQKPRIRALIV